MPALRRLVVALLVLSASSWSGVPSVAAQGAVSPLPLEGFGRGVESGAVAGRGAGRAAPAPRLVVAILFDQYRDDYLDRFRPVFGPDGFRRLVDDGARFRDCTIPYAQTLTGPGHATWLSGAPPSTHGIVANEWYDRAEGGSVAAAGDPAVRSVGVPDGRPGEPASPRWMKAQTVADMLRASTRGAARVVAISDKARGAVLPAGRRPNGVYWLDEQSGRMQTSTYYASELPGWAVAANAERERAFEEARRQPWRPALPEAAFRGTASVDPAASFPHPIEEGRDDERPGAISLGLHPAAMTTLFDFAEAAIEHERLGADDVPDLLVLSVSITDRVGHQFGPDSPEVLDLAHRVDARLGTFLRVLDRRVGRGRWTLSVTSDHGVATSGPIAREFEAAPGDSVGGLSSARLRDWIDGVLQRGLAGVAPKAARQSRWARSVGSGLVTFDDSILAVTGVSRAQAARVVADSAAASPWLAAGFAADDIVTGRLDGALARQVGIGFQEGRSGDVVLVPRPYVYFGWGPTLRASHGTPYRYDRHVPLVLYGWGVRRGVSWTPVSTVDIAPTHAALLGVDAPAHSEGRVLAEGLAIPGPRVTSP